jgi:hypothetical protein
MSNRPEDLYRMGENWKRQAEKEQLNIALEQLTGMKSNSFPIQMRISAAEKALLELQEEERRKEQEGYEEVVSTLSSTVLAAMEDVASLFEEARRRAAQCVEDTNRLRDVVALVLEGIPRDDAEILLGLGQEVSQEQYENGLKARHAWNRTIGKERDIII